MYIHEHTHGDVVVLSLAGDLVLGAPTSKLTDRVRALLHLDRRHIVVDMRHVRYVDSRGLGDLVEALVAATNRGATMRLTNASYRLRDLLLLTRLSLVFDCFDDNGDAAGDDDRLRVH